MAKDVDTVIRDATPLYEAAKSLLGYWLGVEYHEYLGFVLGNIGRWWDAGLILADSGRPTVAFQRCLFDFRALDLELLTLFCGSYFYVQAGHKKANYHLLSNEPKKRVLYLRGYDYEASVRTSPGLAAGYATVDTTRFNAILGRHLAPEFEVFKVLSSSDFHLETIGLDRYYYGKYGRIIGACSAPIRSVYLNAQHWQEGVVRLADRVDFFVAYVSSITPSALWELKLLEDKGYASRTLVVFDREAILTKDLHAGFYERIPGLEIGEPLWLPSKKRTAEQDIAVLSTELGATFAVVSAEAFEECADPVRARIRAASGPLPPGRREGALDFRFYPAVDNATLDYLRGLDAALGREIDPEGCGEIDCLPFRINQILLRVYASLLFGAHDEAGRALAAYAGIMEAARDFYTAGGTIGGRSPQSDFAKYMAVLEDHRDVAAKNRVGLSLRGQERRVRRLHEAREDRLRPAVRCVAGARIEILVRPRTAMSGRDASPLFQRSVRRPPAGSLVRQTSLTLAEPLEQLSMTTLTVTSKGRSPCARISCRTLACRPTTRSPSTSLRTRTAQTALARSPTRADGSAPSSSSPSTARPHGSSRGRARP